MRYKSLYPVKAGNVLCPKGSVKFWDKATRRNYEGRLFIWILRESTVRKKDVLPKRRDLSVQYYMKLDLMENGKTYWMPPVSVVQFESITKWFRITGGYDLVAEGVKYNYHREDVAKFFQTIEAL